MSKQDTHLGAEQSGLNRFGSWSVFVVVLAVVIAFGSSVFINGLALDNAVKNYPVQPANMVLVDTLNSAQQPIPDQVLAQLETDTGLKYSAQLTSSDFTAGESRIAFFDTVAQAQTILGLTAAQTSVLTNGDLLAANSRNQTITFTSDVDQSQLTKNVVGYTPAGGFWLDGPVAVAAGMPANSNAHGVTSRIYAGLNPTQVENLLSWPQRTAHNEVQIQGGGHPNQVTTNILPAVSLGLLLLAVLLVPAVAFGLGRKTLRLSETKTKLNAIFPALLTAVSLGVFGSLAITTILQTNDPQNFSSPIANNFTFTAVSILCLSAAVAIGAALAVKQQNRVSLSS